MKTLCLLSIVVVSCVLAAPAHATSCWRVTGWSSTAPEADAIVVTTSCKTVPINFSWAQVVDGTPPDDLWLLFDLTDSRIEGRYLQYVLTFDHIDTAGKPVVKATIYLDEADNTTELLPYPPEQGSLTSGAVVRLRHLNSGNCLRGLAPNGSAVPNYVCSHDLKLSYVLDNAGGGTMRLRNQTTNQCLYSLNSNGQPLYNWTCWASPATPFAFNPAAGGYRLRNVATGRCIYGNNVAGGIAHTWGCWNDPAMTFRIDIIQQ
jgi:Cytolethal distending toxin A/C domain